MSPSEMSPSEMSPSEMRPEIPGLYLRHIVCHSVGQLGFVSVVSVNISSY